MKACESELFFYYIAGSKQQHYHLQKRIEGSWRKQVPFIYYMAGRGKNKNNTFIYN